VSLTYHPVDPDKVLWFLCPGW